MCRLWYSTTALCLKVFAACLSGLIGLRAPIAQWIERRPPEPEIEVRFLLGANWARVLGSGFLPLGGFWVCRFVSERLYLKSGATYVVAE